MFKKVIACVLIFVLSVSAMWLANPLAPVVKASADTYRSGFSVVPEKEDATGVLLDSGFILSSQNTVTLDYVKANVSIRGGIAFAAAPLKDGRFLLKPSEPLLQNQVYFIDVKIPDGRTVSFAFQTKRDFVVLGSLPDKTATGVPVDSGIELYFSYPDAENIQKYFEISPKVDGRFENYGYATVFIPKKLEAGTVYTVTVKKGLTAAKGAVSLREDYSFSFETSPDEKNSADPFPGALYIYNNWLEYGTGEKPVIPFDLHLNGSPSSAEVTMKVFKFNSLEDFLNAIREREKVPSWAYYSFSKNRLDTSGLKKVLEFKQSFNLQNWQYRYMMSPETLSEGFYLAELSTGKLSAQAFLQISDVSAYTVSDSLSTLFWLNDLKTGAPVMDAVILDYNGNQTGKTDASGLAKLAKAEKTGNGRNLTLDFYKVTTKDGRVSLINNGYSYDGPVPYIYPSGNEGLYWRYIQTDRSLYKPNDLVEFWGFIKSRVDGSIPQDITVELSNGGFYYPMKAGIIGRYMPFVSKPLETMSLKTEGGFYEGRMQLPALDPGSYTLTVKSGDKILSSTYFQVENYIKPQYKLEITSDKKAVFVDEKITFTVKASFFDGTPVANVPIRYSINGYFKSSHNQGVTDSTGVLRIEYTPAYESPMQGESYCSINASAQMPETGQISEYYSFRVFANDITFWPQGEIRDGKGTVNVTVSAVNLDTLNDEDPSNDNFTGGPVAGRSLHISVSRTTWERIETGEEYDFINKAVRKTYEYREKRIPVAEADLITAADGTARYEFPAAKGEEGYYTATITAKDIKGRSMKSEASLLTSPELGYPGHYDNYFLKADKEAYKAGETVNLAVMKNNEALKDMRTLFVESRNGIQNYSVKDRPSISASFPEAYAPNYYVDGIVFTGKGYLQTNTAVVYDYGEKKLNLEIKTDKTSYRPGESMTITVKATDNKGRPVAAKVNLSLVDEALLKLSGQYIDPLTQLYTWIESGITCTINSRVYAYGGYGAPVARAALDDSTGVKATFYNAQDAIPMPAASQKDADGSAYRVRSDFKDTAGFKTISLNENGLGAYTLRLPDNITSFSLAAAAVSGDLHAGSVISSAKVSMPFFINDALSLDYLAGDKPFVGVTAYGEELSENETVSFELAVKELGDYKQTAAAKAYQRVYLALPKLSEGTYTVEIKARSQSGKTDALRRTITVYPSYRTIETASIRKLEPNMKIDAGKSGITTLIITDEGRGRIISSLHSLSWDCGKRLDQKLVASYARKLLNEAMKNGNYSPEPIGLIPAEYKNEDGGYGILPYAGTDMNFTALVTPLLKDVADTASLKMYFYNALLSEKKAPASALYALAVLGEPVLVDLNKAAATDNLSFEEYLFLGMAYEAMGDLASAQDIYLRKISPYLERKDPYIRVKVKNKDTDTAYRNTALTAVFASRINSPDAAKLYAYVENNSSTTQYVGVEKVLCLSDMLKKLPDAQASFSYTFGGKIYTTDLSKGGCEVIKVPSVSAGLFRVTKTTGNLSILSLYKASYQSATNDAGLTMSRKYYDASGKETTAFKAGDIVKVVISYDIDKTAIDNTYEISDYAPAGLKPLDNPWSYGVKDLTGCRYRQFDGQKVTFVVGKSDKPYKPLVYYARVASPGEYTAEGAVAQGSIVKSSIVTLENTKIVIRP